MICFPNSKINLGLYITEKRPDELIGQRKREGDLDEGINQSKSNCDAKNWFDIFLGSLITEGESFSESFFLEKDNRRYEDCVDLNER